MQPKFYRLAVSRNFYDACGSVSQEIFSLALDFLRDFQALSRSTGGIPGELLPDAGGEAFRAVDLKGGYTAILCCPRKQATCLLMWIDAREQAQAWARCHTCRINPRTGTLQIYEALPPQDPVTPPREPSRKQEPGATEESTANPLARITDEELLDLGIPRELLPRLRALTSRQELEHCGAMLPPEALEALLCRLDGVPAEPETDEPDEAGETGTGEGSPAPRAGLLEGAEGRENADGRGPETQAAGSPDTPADPGKDPAGEAGHLPPHLASQEKGDDRNTQGEETLESIFGDLLLEPGAPSRDEHNRKQNSSRARSRTAGPAAAAPIPGPDQEQDLALSPNRETPETDVPSAGTGNASSAGSGDASSAGSRDASSAGDASSPRNTSTPGNATSPENGDNGDLSGVEDWEKGILSADRAGTVRLIASDHELQEILDAELAYWRIFLHPSQKKLVTMKSLAPALIRGSAGTGKTVTALHRAVALVSRPDWDPARKLLFTTFTTNLACDLASQLRLLCPADLLSRIEVSGIDAWVSRYLRKMAVDLQIVYPDQPIFRECWQEARSCFDDDALPGDSFCREEYLRVILPQGISGEREYLHAVRRGRGKSLSREGRRQLWPLFEELRVRLRRRGLITFEEACTLACTLIRENPWSHSVGAVVADETQDLSAQSLKLLSCLATPPESTEDAPLEPRIFLVGDGHQRIYDRTASLGACGINVRGRRSRKLRITYRTTDEIRQAASLVLSRTRTDNMDGGEEDFAGDTALRHGLAPVIMTCGGVNEEERQVLREITDLTSGRGRICYQMQEICITARTGSDLETFRRFLEENRVPTVLISPHQADDPLIQGVRLATMHRIKGLEFKVIFMINMSRGTMPLETADTDDELERQRRLTSERCLFYVAATRARDRLYITSRREDSAFLQEMRSAFSTDGTGEPALKADGAGDPADPQN